MSKVGTTSKVSVSLAKETRARLDALAKRMEMSVGDCLQQAVSEFVDGWEDHLRTVEALQSDEARPILRAVNE